MKHKMIMTVVTLSALSSFTFGLRAASAEDLPSVAALSTPEKARMTTVARPARARPGALIAVDVYLSGIDDLGAYQISLRASGGTRGALTVESVDIDRTRPDQVFGEEETIDVLNDQPGLALIAVVSVAEGVAVGAQPMYAGTFYLRASRNAKGTFLVNIKRGPASSMIITSRAVPVPLGAGEPTPITIATRKAVYSDKDD